MNNVFNFINVFTLCLFSFLMTSCDKDETITPPNPDTNIRIPDYCSMFKTELENFYKEGIKIPDSMLRVNNASAVQRGFIPILPEADDCININQYQNAFDTTHINLVNEFSYLNLNPNTLTNVNVPLYVKIGDYYSINNNILNIVILSYLKSDTSNRLVFDFRGINYNSQGDGGITKLKWNTTENRIRLAEKDRVSVTTTIPMNNENMTIFQLFPYSYIANTGSIARGQFPKSDTDGYYEVINNNVNPLQLGMEVYPATELLFKTAPGTSYNWDYNRQREWFHDVLDKTKDGFYFKSRHTIPSVNVTLIVRVTLD